MPGNLAITKSVVKDRRRVGYTRCMVNEQAEPRADEEPAPSGPSPMRSPTLPPLVILATDDEAVCVDDLCLPPDVER